MVNTLWNAPEKVTFTPKGSSSSALKKIVAAAIALTLSGQPAEAKTYNKQEFSTEMVANVPWTISPMTENIEQTSTPDYYNKALNWVKKYYPEHEEYFKGIINTIRSKKYESYLLNDEIDVNLTIAWDLLENEKETITTLLISLEKAVWKWFFKTRTWISDNSDINDISNYIIKWFKERYKKTKTNLDDYENEINNLNRRANTEWISNIWIEYITISEKYMQLLKDYFIDYGLIKKSKDVQNRVKIYIDTLKETGKKPSQIWQKYIDEYNKVKN